MENISDNTQIGLCLCGCGNKTTVANRNDKRRGWIKNKPIRFIKGHNGILNIHYLLPYRGSNRGKTWHMGDKTKVSEHCKTRLIGKNHWNWKGGISCGNKADRIRFRETIQKLVIERDDYTCQLCGERGGSLQVDHIQSWAEFIDKRFDMNNCRTLCMGCHYFITYGRPMPPDVVSWGHNFLGAKNKCI